MDAIEKRVEMVVAHSARVTLRVGDVFMKIDADQGNLDVEAQAMAFAPIRTPRLLWTQPHVIALAALPGTALGRLGEPSTASARAWAAAGAAIRTLHEAPLPPWEGKSVEKITENLDAACKWLTGNGVLPADLVARNREVAQAALRPWKPVFIHGDLQVCHVFIDDRDMVSGVLDWSEAASGDGLADIATLTLGHRDRLPDVLAGYGANVDLDVIRGWWSLRALSASRWLIEHGYDPNEPGCEFDVLRAAM